LHREAASGSESLTMNSASDEYVHPLLRELLENVKDTFSRLARERQAEMRGQGTYAPTISPAEAYHYWCFTYATRLARSPLIRRAHVLMRAIPNRLRLRKMGMSRTEFIQYHYANAVVIQQGAVDIALNLTSRLLRLGIPQGKVNMQLVAENEWVKDTVLGEALKALDQATQPSRKSRNEWAHRGESFRIEELNDVFLYDETEELIHRIGGKRIVPEALLLKGIEKGLEAATARVSSETDELERRIRSVFDALQDPYRKWSKLVPVLPLASKPTTKRRKL
jgi:hypothetical protein